jgi:hypothetical protein
MPAAVLPLNGSELVEVVQSGQSRKVPLIALQNMSVPRGVWIEQFGGVGDGVTDDYAAFMSAASYVQTQLGAGVIYIGERTYAISNKISLPSGVGIVGVGAGQYPGFSFTTSSNFTGTPKSRIKARAGFPALTPVIETRTPNNATYTNHGHILQGFMIDCALIADYGLDCVSVKNSYYTDLLIFKPNLIGIREDCLVSTITGTAVGGGANYIDLPAASSSYRDNLYNNLTISITSGTGAGQSKTISAYVGATGRATVSSNWTVNPNATSVYQITGVGTTEGNNATQGNVWTGIQVFMGTGTTSVGWTQDGNTNHNVNMNDYRMIKVVHAIGDGFHLFNCDTNFWHQVITYSTSTGIGAILYGSDKNTIEFCRNNTWVGTQFAGPAGATGGVLAKAGTVQPSIQNMMVAYSTGNSTPLPVIENMARLRYFSDVNMDVTDPTIPTLRLMATRDWTTLNNQADIQVWGRLIGTSVDTKIASIKCLQADTAGAGTELTTWRFSTWSAGVLTERGYIGQGWVVGSAGTPDNGPGTLTAQTAFYVGVNKVVGARETGWTPASGVAGNKGAFVAAVAGTASAGYVQAEANAALTRIAALEARVRALDDMLRVHGLSGA